MASFETLPTEQRAVLSLVLQSGLNYDEIATMLSIDRATVRQRALAGLETLVGGSDTGGPERALIADYVLGQLPPRVAEMTMARLGRSPAEQGWASAAKTQIEALSLAGALGKEEAPASAGAQPRPSRRSSRRGGAVLLVVLAAICVSVVIIILGRSGSQGPVHTGTGTTVAQANGAQSTSTTQSTPTTTAQSTPTTTTPAPEVLGRVTLTPPPGAASSKALGVALIVKVSARKGIAIAAQGLTRSPSHEYYAVWLTKGTASAFLGFVAQGVSSSGKLLAQSPLPANASRFSELLITLETQSHPTSPGTIVLQGGFKLPG
jgi:sigma-70-like protein